MARETLSRVESSGGRRASVCWPSTAASSHARASASSAAYSWRRASGRYFHMNRSPLLLRRMPPSPRTPSVTSRPMTPGGHTMPVGWNWRNSMSISSAPASKASVCPSPVYSQEFEVTWYALPTPPVAMTIALQRNSTKRPVSRR